MAIGDYTRTDYTNNTTPALNATNLDNNEAKVQEIDDVLSGASAGACYPAVQGIKFPATQVPSSDANTLDDYEEGTWTPGISFGGAAVGVTYSTQTGTYTKIGRIVTFQAYVVLTSKGSSTGNAMITGLPFTASSTAYRPCGFVPATITFADQIFAMVTPSGTTITLYEVTNAGTFTNITNADFANASSFWVSGTYSV